MRSERDSIYLTIFGFACSSLITLIGVGLSIEGFSSYQAAANFWNNAIATTGIITNTEETMNCTYYGSLPSCSNDSITTIRFTTLQREIIKFESDTVICINRTSSNPCEGRKVEIVYDSSNPHQAIVKGSASPRVRVIFRIGVGVIFVIFGMLFIKVQLSEFRAR